MTFDKTRPFGISAALTTPFNAAGNVDIALLVSHVQDALAKGCTSVTLGGTTGEGPSLSQEEKVAAHNAMTAAGVPADKIVFAIIESSLPNAVAFARQAAELGSAHILLAPPYYFKGVADSGQLAWFRAFLTEIAPTGLKVILYHIPQVTAAAVTPDMVAELKKDFPALITGVKDSAGNWDNTEELLKRFPDLDILIGDERLLANGVALGAAGSISGVANFRPDLLTAILAGKPADPRLPELVEALLQYPVTPAVKALVGHLGSQQSWLAARAPLARLSPAQYQALAKRYDELFASPTR
ncbi:dihydrodipicolinate synthase family protein [Thalassospira marina]|uniref:Dihydrodipicolinate synthase family protein n=1 Tax=Thalassospira marina TaxID=2048283 RepID=A0A2N3KW87_9PROT|nr:dihydrodipicolinate synthase family protein [Thalassospira marina]PKR54798.1 dihydrodipicolinate synthase family protein [Thalassospira marina]